LDTGTLLLDGDGVFRERGRVSQIRLLFLHVDVWAKSKELADQTRATLLQAVGPCRIREQMFVIDWQFCNNRGTLMSTSFDEIADRSPRQ